MSQRAQHAKARASMQEPIAIQGVWRNVLDLPNIDEGHISHIVEPSGILSSPEASELG